MVYGEAALTLRGERYPLLYSVRAIWELKERLKERDPLEVLRCRSLEDFYLAWEAAGVLSRCHAAASWGLGEAPGPQLEPEEWVHIVTPEETVELADAAARALKLGMARKHQQGDVDKGLSALRKKNGQDMSYAQYLRCGVVNGYTPDQTLDLTPGVLFDLWELYLDGTGRRKKEE